MRLRSPSFDLLGVRRQQAQLFVAGLQLGLARAQLARHFLGHAQGVAARRGQGLEQCVEQGGADARGERGQPRVVQIEARVQHRFRDAEVGAPDALVEFDRQAGREHAVVVQRWRRVGVRGAGQAVVQQGAWRRLSGLGRHRGQLGQDQARAPDRKFVEYPAHQARHAETDADRTDIGQAPPLHRVDRHAAAVYRQAQGQTVLVGTRK
ncbi:hypothetical protein [Massilia sp. UYP11]|uniref:hypothetical protein n=1 Tax=Massilia sp. UYP11 TaxID=1756385 RepID=UPI003D1D8511